jgi:hypothetical protein
MKILKQIYLQFEDKETATKAAEKAESLGYKHWGRTLERMPSLGGMNLYGDGDYQLLFSNHVAITDLSSLEEFFSLTKEDVIVQE